MIKSKNISSQEAQFHTVTLSAKNAKANILIVHGLGEHIGRYAPMMEMFADLGMNVYGYDRRGEGQTSGRRAYIHNMSDQVEDLAYIKDILIKDDMPLYLYGHSLGGLITIKYLIDHQPSDVEGVVLSGALLKVDEGISPLLQKLSGVVAAIAPKLQTVKVDTKLLSTDPKVRPAYESDPYVYHGGTPAKTGDQILKVTKSISEGFGTISLPILITHGGNDQLSDPNGSRGLFDGISSTDKTLKIYDGMYHEIMHEVEKDVFLNDVKTWLKERLQ